MFDTIYLVSPKLITGTSQDIIQLEDVMGFELPDSYHIYSTTLGRGWLCDTIWMFEPAFIQSEYQTIRNRWAALTQLPTNITQEQLQMSIPIAKTDEGDQFIYNPLSPERIFILPGHNNIVYWTSSTFQSLLQWESAQGVVQKTPTFLYFEPDREDRWQKLGTLESMHIFMEELIHLIQKRLALPIAHRLDEQTDVSQTTILFYPSIGGRLELTHDYSDEDTVYIMINYDSEYEKIIQSLVAILQEYGFDE
ncbi:MAG: hypothetical protein AAGF95_06240 [Chloroflexota bacterium]